MSLPLPHGARDVLSRLRSPLSSPRAPLLLVCGATALAGLVVAHEVTLLHGSHALPKPLVLVLAVAGGVILLTLDTEQVLLGWLFLAPLLQESAGKDRIGHLLSLALYTAPPVVIGIKTLAQRRSFDARRWFDVVPLLFVAYVLASLAITSPSLLRSGAVGTLRAFFQTVGLGAFCYYLAVYWRGRGLSRVNVCRIMLATTTMQAAMTTVEWGSGWNLWHDRTWQEPGDVRSIGTLGNPALTGGFIGAGIAIAVVILVWRGPVELRRLATAAILIGIPGLLATKTRGPILATVIACMLVLLLNSRARVLGLGLMALVALTIALFWPQIRSSTVYQSRIDEKQNVEIRLVLQRISIKLAEERPILGWGYNSFDRVKFNVPVRSTVPLKQVLQFTSHNTYLTIVDEYGVVGLLLFLAPWAAVLVSAVRGARFDSPDRWFLLVGLAAVFVIGMTATTLDYRFFSFVPAVPWLFLGLMRRTTEHTPQPIAAPATL